MRPRHRLTRLSNARRRQLWMQQFSRLVLEQRPEFAGRLEWPDATYYYLQGYAAGVATEKYLAARPDTVKGGT